MYKRQEKARLEAELRARAAEEQAKLEAQAAQKLQDELGVVQQLSLIHI